MKSILQQLYDGQLAPVEQDIPRTLEYRKLRQAQHRSYEDFIGHLKELEPESAERFIKIMDEQLDRVPIEYSQSFIGGFCLGAKMMIEVYQSDFGK